MNVLYSENITAIEQRISEATKKIVETEFKLQKLKEICAKEKVIKESIIKPCFVKSLCFIPA